MTDLTVAVTVAPVTVTLPTGKKLTLDIEGGRYVMKGGYFGTSSIAVDPGVTSPERLSIHWDGYVESNVQEDAKHSGMARPLSRLEKEMAAALAKAETLPKSMSLRGPGGLLLSLKACEIFPEDPGEGCPAVVYAAFGKASSTYDCAINVGHLDADRMPYEDVELTGTQMHWLDKCAPVVDAFVSGWFKRIEANPDARPARK